MSQLELGPVTGRGSSPRPPTTQTSTLIVHMASSNTASSSSTSSSVTTTPEHPSPELSVASTSYVVPPTELSHSPSPTRSTTTTPQQHHHHPNFANHVHESYYTTQTSFDSSPPPYTDTMASTSTGRLRADSTADSVDSFRPRPENVRYSPRPPGPSRSPLPPITSRPSSSRDYLRRDSLDTAAAITANREKKLGHRRVAENGVVTYKNIQSSQIMHSIQLGIGHSVGSLASKPERDVLYNDFNTVETVLFPTRGSTTTPAHHYSDFEFTTYTPNAFRHFRDLFRIQPDDYMLSMTNEPLSELSNPGASGSVFYRTADDHFIIKTVEKNESKFLLKLLPGYYMNLSQNPHTLLPKFFGLYTYECGGKNIRIIVMNNLLPSNIRLHEKYDLKGSTYKRKASDGEKSKKSPTYKDLDFLEKYHLMERFSRSTLALDMAAAEKDGPIVVLPNGTVNGLEHDETSFGGLQLEAHVYDELINTLQRDCRVLESFEIMDYSLLVGVHNYDKELREEEGAVVFDYEDDEQLPVGAIRAKNHRGDRLLLFVGIIDILQSYRLFKKVEHAWKALLHDGDTVSVHRPKFYARRFLNFMAKYVFSRLPPPGGAANADSKYSLYYQVAESQRKYGYNSLTRNRNQQLVSFHQPAFR